MTKVKRIIKYHVARGKRRNRLNFVRNLYKVAKEELKGIPPRITRQILDEMIENEEVWELDIFGTNNPLLYKAIPSFHLPQKAQWQVEEDIKQLMIDKKENPFIYKCKVVLYDSFYGNRPEWIKDDTKFKRETYKKTNKNYYDALNNNHTEDNISNPQDELNKLINNYDEDTLNEFIDYKLETENWIPRSRFRR